VPICSTFPRPTAAVPDVSDPDPSTVPDLVALPLWSFTTFDRRGRDYLGFAATPWNAGPAPMVVEGFRRSGEAVMDAYQYFRDADGNVVGRAPVGELHWDARRAHKHWHFAQFALFTLRDADQGEVVRSRKQGFCLAPTNAIDLTVERAVWNPWDNGVGTSCGSEGALWVREVLQTGWADTYFQGIPGQSFNITNLPNGWYYARLEVNPLGALYETTTANNVESRLITSAVAPATAPCWRHPGTGSTTKRSFQNEASSPECAGRGEARTQGARVRQRSTR
jgi:Lysyl oxidase